jgi:hypothetical protein
MYYRDWGDYNLRPVLFQAFITDLRLLVLNHSKARPMVGRRLG